MSMVRNFEPCAWTEWMHCQEQGIRKVIGTMKKKDYCYGGIFKKTFDKQKIFGAIKNMQ